jgi:hypothetical protein
MDGSGQFHAKGALPPGKNPGSHSIGVLGGPQSRLDDPVFELRQSQEIFLFSKNIPDSLWGPSAS